MVSLSSHSAFSSQPQFYVISSDWFSHIWCLFPWHQTTFTWSTEDFHLKIYVLSIWQPNQEQGKLHGYNCTAVEICSTFPNLKRQFKINPQATNSPTPQNNDKKAICIKFVFFPSSYILQKDPKVVKSILHMTHGKIWGFTVKRSVVSCLFSFNLLSISPQDVIPDTQIIVLIF